MKKRINSITLTIWATRLVALIMFVLLFTLPALLDWYCQYRILEKIERISLMAGFYCCAGVVFYALWRMDCLLRCIHRGEVFTRDNVKHIRAIRGCCAATCLICIPAAICYYPLVFLVVIMGFLSLAVTVVCRVMDAAVSIREENDLTI